MSFYAAQFDARLVIAQISACFFLSTLSLSTAEWLIHQAFGTQMTIRDLYDFRTLSLDTVQDVVSCVFRLVTARVAWRPQMAVAK